MSTPRDALVALARLTSARAHAPYSGIHVGAAIRSAAGVAAEGARFRIAETAVWAVDRDGQAIAISPCGGELCASSIDELLPHAFELPRSPSGR
jgi:cytidine deaminase